jgi:hypothetical protein
MKTRIETLTVVSAPGVHCYQVGDLLNGMRIHRIVECLNRVPDSVGMCFQGLTESGDIAFEVINCSVDIEYKQEQ